MPVMPIQRQMAIIALYDLTPSQQRLLIIDY